MKRCTASISNNKGKRETNDRIARKESIRWDTREKGINIWRQVKVQCFIVICKSTS